MKRYRAVVAALAASVALAGCSGSGDEDKKPSESSDPSAIAFTVDMTTCGDTWSAPEGGTLSFAITNAYRSGMDVYLADPGTGAVYQEWEGIGTGATLTAGATLGNGTYQFQCFPDDAASVVGPAVSITDADGVKSSPAVQPLALSDLVPVTKRYQAWVVGRLPLLDRQVGRLAQDVAEGDSAAAKADWLLAHETYETLGAAYDAFGDSDAAINGAPAMHESAAQAAKDKDLTGFRKVEALLWTGAPAAQLKPAVAELRTAVSGLANQLTTTDIDPNLVGLRAHEIIENTIQFELNGYTDAGSHTNLATVSANLTGAAKTLDILAPLLAPRYPGLRTTEAALAESQRLVSGFDHGGANTPDSWPPLESLSTSEREHVNASLLELVELLAQVAAISDERQASQ